MKIDEVELRIVRLPYRAPFVTSFGAESQKVALLTTVRSDGVEGYGEGVMDPLPMYREETLAGARSLLEQALVPDLLAHGCTHPVLYPLGDPRLVIETFREWNLRQPEPLGSRGRSSG